jgi:hypothetical protein
VTAFAMPYLRAILLAAALLLPGAALASERGMTIRAGDLFAEPFIDAAKLGPLPANQAVTILARKGGWLSIETGGKRGWVRMLIVRLESVAAGTSTAALRTGSTGRTIATGVKGLDEGSIRNAAIDRAQLAKLDELGASEADARGLAAENDLKESQIANLKPGKAK